MELRKELLSPRGWKCGVSKTLRLLLERQTNFLHIEPLPSTIHLLNFKRMVEQSVVGAVVTGHCRATKNRSAMKTVSLFCI